MIAVPTLYNSYNGNDYYTLLSLSFQSQITYLIYDIEKKKLQLQKRQDADTSLLQILNNKIDHLLDKLPHQKDKSKTIIELQKVSLEKKSILTDQTLGNQQYLLEEASLLFTDVNTKRKYDKAQVNTFLFNQLNKKSKPFIPSYLDTLIEEIIEQLEELSLMDTNDTENHYIQDKLTHINEFLVKVNVVDFADRLELITEKKLNNPGQLQSAFLEIWLRIGYFYLFVSGTDHTKIPEVIRFLQSQFKQTVMILFPADHTKK